MKRNPKAEGRDPKEDRNPKPEKPYRLERTEGDNAKQGNLRISWLLSFRISQFGLLSGFGLRSSDFPLRRLVRLSI
jgi:hypothetical protein